MSRPEKKHPLPDDVVSTIEPAVIHHVAVERLVTTIESAAAEARRERAKAQCAQPPTARVEGRNPGESTRFSFD